MNITIPELSLVVLIGPSGSGKSTFARKHFKDTESVSSDRCRGWVSDDENSQDATNDAFEVLHFIAAKRLAAAKLTVVDATNVQAASRKPLVELARKYHCLPVAIVFNLPESVCIDRNRTRPDRAFGPHVVRQHSQSLRRSLRGLDREGFRHVHVLSTPEEVEAAVVVREPLWNNLRREHGPFDIIGDIHGCFEELCGLLERLGYAVSKDTLEVRPPEGRKAVFLGDLVDRGPGIVPTLKLVMGMVKAGTALCVPGNHEMKLLRKLRGKDVKVSHGLAESIAQLDAEPLELRQAVSAFADDLVSHYVLDDGKLVVAHAGMKESMQGRGSGQVRAFALYGETTGETDEYGLPVRYDWAAEYRGKAMVVYGHTPVPEAEWLNNTICIDTGCVFGGKLTALRYPERELVSFPAARAYYHSAKPFPPVAPAAPALTAQQEHDTVLDAVDVLGKRIVATSLARNVTIREENAAAALEVMSRFAADPRWLVYLPPTMSPCETSQLPGALEHPEEAYAYFRKQGVERVVCEEKHMGSRAVVVACRNADVARRRFGIDSGELGIVYTRTGRRFFADGALEAGLLDRVRGAMGAAGLWEELRTDWICLDAEVMPWSLKAQDLIRDQYAAVGAASRAGLAEAASALKRAAEAVPELLPAAQDYEARSGLAARYVEAYGRYCWPVSSLADVKLAPFHVLATETRAHMDQDHRWHLAILARLAAADPGLLVATAHRHVEFGNEESQREATAWWEELTAQGGEGMVVKPLAFVARGKRRVVQPAVKCRGREYLRIIYGPEYTRPEHLSRLRSRGLSVKRSLALREFALGVEGLQRFVRREPLRKVHECVFGVLALESEPVDPRL